MATLRLVIDGKQAGAKFKRNAKRHSAGVRAAFAATALEAAETIETSGRANIASAGNFGSSRWQDGFTATVGQGNGVTKITVRHAVSYWRIFQTGGVINGKPMLWIPLSFASDAIGVRARDYPAPLFRVDRKNGGAPLLMAEGGKPKYFGKDSVTIPKKFRLVEICREVAATMKALYRKNRRNG